MTAAVLTVSDSAHAGTRADASGPRVAEALADRGYHVAATAVVPDDREAIAREIIRFCGLARLVVTTGGTGVAARDVTPEATLSVCDRLLPGIAEHMRASGAAKTPMAILSRAVCGSRGESLVLNLPGSPKGAVESLLAVIDVLPHALALLEGKTEH
ncbi:MAG TPA: MogA/MoaB family molybdenum cofactor biosynthesis protein [Terriglobales bacterium]|nr:MogA/MoaB family molybdenum cofactor biosynthesis protein [Terriglobales bacterium]